jgi:glycerophosphoryl diester phosphodiesterase
VLLAAWYSWRRASALVGYRGPHGVTLDEMAVFLLLHHVHLERIWGRRVDALQIPERYKGLRVVTPRLIERAHRLGLRVHVWTVNGEADMRRLLDWGVDGLITNRPDLALRVRAQQTGKH